MKKFLMMALVAVMAFSAQAVSLTWKIVDPVFFGKSNENQWVASALVAGTENPVLKSYAMNGNTVTDLEFEKSTVAKGMTSFAGDAKNIQATFSTVDVKAGSEYTLFFYAPFQYTNNNGKPAKNAYSSVTFTIPTDWDGYTDLTITVPKFDLRANDNIVFNDGIKIVPEPTVLALLALGVAGLALKRKVA